MGDLIDKIDNFSSIDVHENLCGLVVFSPVIVVAGINTYDVEYSSWGRC